MCAVRNLGGVIEFLGISYEIDLGGAPQDLIFMAFLCHTMM